MKKVKSIYYLVEEGHYGLKMILEFGWSRRNRNNEIKVEYEQKPK